MYRTPPDGFRPSVMPDVFWQPHHQHPPPIHAPAPPGLQTLFSPFMPHGHLGPFLFNSFDNNSQFTPSGSFLSCPTFPVDTSHQSQSQAAPTSLQWHPQSGCGHFSSSVPNNRHHHSQQSQNNHRNRPNYNNNNNNENFNNSFSHNNISLHYQHVSNLTTFSSNTSSSIPSTTSIMQLMGRATWTAWLHGVQSVADILGLLPHINKDSPDFVTSDPLWHAYPPLVDDWSSPQDWEVHLAWRKRDTMMMYVLTSHLSNKVSSAVPMVNDLCNTGTLFTARNMFAQLQHLYGLGDYIQANVAMESLCSFTMDMRNIPKYAQCWRSTMLTLCAESYPIVYIEAVLTFVRNLPEDDHGWFMSLCQEVTQDCGLYPNNIGYDYLISIVGWVTDLDTQWHLSKQSKHTYCQKCDVCSLQSHSMEQHDPSKQHAGDSSTKNPSQSNAQFTTQHHLPNPPTHCANYMDTQDTSPSDNDVAPLDSNDYAAVVIPYTDCTVDSVNDDIVFICMGASILSSSAQALTWFYDGLKDGSFAALSLLVKTMLDSGCTTHIFKERRYFWSYHEDEAVDVRTANCGVLSTKACGEIHICVHCMNGIWVVVQLLDCLHAPDVPMNLISVGALTEWKMYLLFGNNWTSINFPKDHPTLSGARFSATVLSHLSFLHCEILEPSLVDANPLESCMMGMPEPFKHSKPNHHTWHYRLGHPGQDLTTEVLNGDCATGIVSHRPKTKLVCPSCLVGKHAQKPFENNGHHAEFVNKLIHIDTCGPFPTASPQRACYFFAMLEDKMTAAEVQMMKRKNDAFQHFETTVAKWERISGRPVMCMCSDNAPSLLKARWGNSFVRRESAINSVSHMHINRMGRLSDLFTQSRNGLLPFSLT